jgi:hypothetical protein
MRILAVTVLVLSCAGLARGQTWDAAADWLITQNPRGAWSYGGQVSLSDPFVLYTTPGLLTARLQWRRTSGFGDACCPGLGQVINGGYDSVFPEDKIVAHPGPGPDGGAIGGDKGEYSVLRWTAPNDGLYDISILFEGLNSTATLAKVTTTDVHMLVNSVPQLSGLIKGYVGGNPSDPNPEKAPFNRARSWRRVLNLAAGDTLDFAVGDGHDQSYFSDVTGITARITLVPEPTSLLLFGVMGAALATFRVRFR